MKYDAVLEGGGVKGTAHVGALAAIEAKGFEPSHLAGASAGSIVAALRAAGYTPAEMKSLLAELDYHQFLDGRSWQISRVYDFWKNYGYYKGDVFYEWIRGLLAQKGVRTFGDIAIAGQSDLRYRWPLKVTVSDLTKQSLRVMPDDAGPTTAPDQLEVALAIRMSMSIPYFFRPVQYGGNYIVDGGTLSNFPLWIFDAEGVPDHPTFGLLLEDSAEIAQEQTIGGPVEFFQALLNTMLRSHDKQFIRPGDFLYRTIKIPTGAVGTIDFGITSLKKDWLYHSGQLAANTFLANWKFEDYKAWAVKTRGGIQEDGTGTNP